MKTCKNCGREVDVEKRRSKSCKGNLDFCSSSCAKKYRWTHDYEFRENQIRVRKGIGARPEFRAKMSIINMEINSRPEVKSKKAAYTSMASKERWKNSEIRNGIIKKLKNRWQTLETRARHYLSAKEYFESDRSLAHKAIFQTEDYKKGCSERSIKNWGCKEYRKKQSESLKIALSTPEQRERLRRNASIEGNKSERKELQRKIAYKNFNTPESRKKNAASQRTPEARLKRSFISSSPEFQKKRYETLKKNKSFIKSSTEDNLYKLLLSIFPDSKHHYRDTRYPWAADYYIPSHDLFIEYHGTWTHGHGDCHESYDPNNPNHQKKLKWLQKKSKEKHFSGIGNKTYYDNVIYTWAKLDPLKVSTAQSNGVKLLVFYTENEAKHWIYHQNLIKILKQRTKSCLE